MQIALLVAIALAPCIAIIFFIYYRDQYEKEPAWLLLVSFLAGIVSVIPAIFVELFFQNIPLINDVIFLRATMGIGYVEEGWKLFFLLIIPYWRKAFNEPLDGIIYAMMISMGFAGAENVLYVVKGGWGVGVLRAFTAVPAHAIFAVIMGYFVGLGKFSKSSSIPYIVVAFLLSGMVHGLYDFFLMEKSVPGIWLGAILSLILGVIFSLKAIQTHRNFSKQRLDKKQEEASTPDLT